MVCMYICNYENKDKQNVYVLPHDFMTSLEVTCLQCPRSDLKRLQDENGHSTCLIVVLLFIFAHAAGLVQQRLLEWPVPAPL